MNPKRYRKKPVIIEAIQMTDDVEEVVRFVGADNLRIENGAVGIYTLEGLMRVSPFDYIVKGVKGEFYPVKPDIFHATYEEE